MPSKRRDKGEGSISLKGKGDQKRWVGYLTVGYRNGKPIRKYTRSYYLSRGGKKADAAAELREMQRRRDRQLPIQEDRQRLAEYYDRYVEQTVKAAGISGTIIQFEAIGRNYIKPALGHIPIGKLTPNDVRDKLIGPMLQRGLSANTVRSAHSLLRTVLEQACREEAILRNVCRLVKPPKKPEIEPKHLELDEAKRLMEAIAAHRDRIGLMLSLFTGMRKSEVCGLLWSEVAQDLSQARVCRQWKDGRMHEYTKTSKSRRKIPLLPLLQEEMRLARQRQAEQRLAAGPLWDDRSFVACSESGRPMHNSRLWEGLQECLDAAGIERMPLHALRHTCASLLSEAGVDPLVIQKWLGHATDSMTKHYIHTSQAQLRDAAKKFGDLFS